MIFSELRGIKSCAMGEHQILGTEMEKGYSPIAITYAVVNLVLSKCLVIHFSPTSI
jgi:hypothetical protein